MSKRIGSREPLLCPPSCRSQRRKLRRVDSPPDFPCVERDGKTFCPSLIACKSQGAKRLSSVAECVGIQLLDDDTMIEILSRLPVELLPVIKCVCKQWFHLIKSNSFRFAHFEKSKKNGVTGTFLQGMFYCPCCKDVKDYPSIDFVGIDKKGEYIVKKNMLDFLPEKVVVTSSSNGLVICRSLFRRKKAHKDFASTKNPPNAELVIYVCNPLTKEFRVLRPNLMNKDRCTLGLAFESPTCFEILLVRVLKKANDSFCYVFKIFSSKTNTWRVSKDKCYYPHRLLFQFHAFADGVFYWLALGHSILAFDLAKEKSHIIKLPGPVLRTDGGYGMCIGVSESKVHYVTLTRNEFMVWILTGDYPNMQWELKHFRHVANGKLVEAERWDGKLCTAANSYNAPYSCIKPLALKDDVVLMQWNYTFTGYNLKTGDIEKLSSYSYLETSSELSPVILPYTRSLLHVFP